MLVLVRAWARWEGQVGTKCRGAALRRSDVKETFRLGVAQVRVRKCPLDSFRSTGQKI